VRRRVEDLGLNFGGIAYLDMGGSGSLSANAHVRRKERAEHGAPLLCGYERRTGECKGGEADTSLLFAEDFAHAADLGAYVAELFFHALVAAIHVVDAVEDAFAIGYESCED